MTLINKLKNTGRSLGLASILAIGSCGVMGTGMTHSPHTTPEGKMLGTMMTYADQQEHEKEVAREGRTQVNVNSQNQDTRHASKYGKGFCSSTPWNDINRNKYVDPEEFAIKSSFNSNDNIYVVSCWKQLRNLAGTLIIKDDKDKIVLTRNFLGGEIVICGIEDTDRELINYCYCNMNVEKTTPPTGYTGIQEFKIEYLVDGQKEKGPTFFVNYDK